MIKKDISTLLDFSRSVSGEYFKTLEYPWEILSIIGKIIAEISKNLGDEYEKRGEDIYIHKSAKISEEALLTGPLIICEEAEIRKGAFIRGKAIIGKKAVVGNSTEIKNSILFDEVQAPHYNYIGDSVVGYKAHMGAGVIISNLRLDKNNIKVKLDDGIIETGLRKFGAIIGDFCEIGCNSVINPGRIIGKKELILPLSCI